jgi:hypothetical protein
MNVRLILAAAASAALTLSGTARAADLVVPDQFPTIQAAVDAAVAGDTVLVKPGTYFEAVTIGFKTITLASTDGAATTIIDGANQFRPLYITGPNYTPAIRGFTIQNGNAWAGGGVLVDYQADPSFHDVIVRNNRAYYGGGMYLGYGACWVSIVDSQISDNVADYYGGGTYGNVSCTWYVNTRIERNVAGVSGGGVASHGFCSMHIAESSFITQNVANADGGGMWAAGSSSCSAGVRGRNAVIARNVAVRGGGVATGPSGGVELLGATITQNTNGGLFAQGAQWLDVTNSIIWDNGAAPVFIPGGTVKGVDMEGGVQTGFNGDGTNISADPLFVDTVAGDYRLSAGSPCINTGVVPAYAFWQTTDIDGNARAEDGTGFDIGAYEFSLLKIPATVKVDPETFGRCKSGGNATVTVTLPAGFDPNQVLVPSVFVNDAFSTTRASVENGVLQLKFPKDAFVEYLQDRPDGQVTITLTGEIPGIARFTGTSVIRVKTAACK